MKVLLLAGLGPYFKQYTDLVGTLFDLHHPNWPISPTNGRALSQFRLQDLTFCGPNGQKRSLLRRERSGSLSLALEDQQEIDRAPIPNLSAGTLVSILAAAEVQFEYLPLDAIWDGEGEPSTDAFAYILLSTTFICDRISLGRAISWITARLPNRPIILGGQFSNLKYESVLRDHPEVTAVVRGDGELALPLLLQALEGGHDLTSIPNLVFRNPATGAIVSNLVHYIDLESHAAPSFPGRTAIVPYESMRGCPFSCKFCSFPAASPKWRYKSAQRIASDWRHYRDVNGAMHMRALDSTFTIPQTRFHELLELLPSVGIGWEAFTRANVLSSPSVIDALARAKCRTLSIGFESMSDNSLSHMNKLVSAQQNRAAFHLLRGSPVGYRASFMAGYPGETPDDYDETHNFLVNEYEGHFQLSVFSLQDETMPVWEDAQRFDIRVDDPANPDYSWRHAGMDVNTARALRKQTLHAVRWYNEGAVPFIWQPDYQTPLLPHESSAVNYRVEKLVERIGFLPVDYPDPRQSAPLVRAMVEELHGLGVNHPSFSLS